MNYILTNRQFNDKLNFIVPALDVVFDKIRVALQQKGLNQKELAEFLKVSEPTISRIMSKKRGLSVETLIKIAEIINVNPASLLPGENPSPKPALDEYIWNSIKEKLDKYLEEKFKELLNKK